MFWFADRIKETSTTTGTGAFDLGGAVAKFRAFSDVLSANDWCFYTAVNLSANEWETGIGRLVSGDLERNPISSSNSNALVNFSSGTKEIFIAAIAASVAASSSFYFGDGSAGDVTISSGTTTLSADAYYKNLTISGTGSLRTNGYRVFVSEILDLTNAPADAIQWTGSTGGNASGTTGGTSGGNQTSVNTGRGGDAIGGPNGGTASGTTASNGAAANPGNGGAGGGSLAGGSGSSGSGGSSRTGGAVSNALAMRVFTPWLHKMTSTSTISFLLGGGGGSGGSSGGGDGTAGGGGGAGSGGGGVVFISARIINRGGSTAAGAISAKGGGGGNGGTPAGGNRGGGAGGSGAGGGWLALAFGFLIGSTATNALDVSGGTGGTGGNGTGTGTGGGGGGGGNGGRISVWNLGTGAYTETAPGTGGSAGGAASGTTGGSGGAGETRRANL